jgi:hypothetical protein
MKLIFKDTGILWIIDRSEEHEDVDGCVSIIAPKGFNPVKERIEKEGQPVEVYKTLQEVQAELGV